MLANSAYCKSLQLRKALLLMLVTLPGILIDGKLMQPLKASSSMLVMPYGIDNEQYSVLGIIKNFEKITNEFSKELVYNLIIECNGILLNVVINSLDLQGEPKIGRRFKGIIWLQGNILFH